MISSLNPDLTINFAREQKFLEFARSPERLERIVNEKIASPNRPLLDQSGLERPLSIFVDEVQRLPSLLNTVQAILDEHPRRIKFYLTGSSARKLKNLLPGRINTYEMGPLCIDELGDSLATPNGLDTALSTGTLPGIWFEESLSEQKNSSLLCCNLPQGRDPGGEPHSQLGGLCSLHHPPCSVERAHSRPFKARTGSPSCPNLRGPVV